jgi:hypothetical protein
LLDLPITCLLAGYYLIHAIGEDNVALYGEEKAPEKIKILPYWECLQFQNKSFETIINQDSLPEISDNLIMEYLKQIKRIGSSYFFSINHDFFYPKTVAHFVKSSGGFHEIYRAKCWVREGYVEEVFRIQ